MTRRLTRSQSSNLQIHSATTSEDEEYENDVLPSTSSGARSCLSQGSGEKRIKKDSTSCNITSIRNTEFKNISLQEEIDLAGKIIRFLFLAEKKKHVVQKVHIVKNVLGGNTKNFQQIMEIVKSYLSKVFGYKLVDTGHGKYILVNEIKNDIPHLKFTKSIKSQQVLLFLVLTQIFMYQDVCREETLWDFLRHSHIIEEDNFQHEYFGDVKKLITVDFVAQHYLQRILVDKGDTQKYEYKWGIRAEHEVSRRDILQFISKVYGDCPTYSWMRQYRSMLQKEKSEES